LEKKAGESAHKKGGSHRRSFKEGDSRKKKTPSRTKKEEQPDLLPPREKKSLARLRGIAKVAATQKMQEEAVFTEEKTSLSRGEKREGNPTSPPR